MDVVCYPQANKRARHVLYSSHSELILHLKECQPCFKDAQYFAVSFSNYTHIFYRDHAAPLGVDQDVVWPFNLYSTVV